MKPLASLLVAMVALRLLLCAASACDSQTPPTVGVVNTIVQRGGYAYLILRDVYALNANAWSHLASPDTNGDGYADIVKAYLAQNHTLLETVKWGRGERVYYSVKLLKTISIQKGDIIVNGPHGSLCTFYAFSAIFSPDGTLRYDIMEPLSAIPYFLRDARSYAYVGCARNGCKRGGQYILDGKTVTLSPGQYYTPATGLIKAIVLIASGESPMDGPVEGAVVAFAGATLDLDGLAPLPASQPNIFKRFVRWLLSLLS